MRRLRPLTLSLLAACAGAHAGDADWPAYGRDPGGMRHSPLTQIDRSNVARLQPAWTFHVGDIFDGKHDTRRSGLETTPIMVDGTLYLTTPVNRVIALDPATGRQRWAYDPKLDLHADFGDGLINRGVATWLDPQQSGDRPCRRRIYEATLDARLIALDAATGQPCADFGKDGQVNLAGVDNYQRGKYHMTSPPAVVDGVVVVGSSINDNDRADMPSGVVRGYDARTGALRWRWDPIEKRGKDWLSGAANAWSVMAVDEARGLVYVPTGSASPDYYGGRRPGDDHWANSVVALHARDGRLAWGFQLVHHDLWDYDTASPPLLATLRRDKREVPVVVQGNKTGYLYVLDRATGKPVLPVEERPVPASAVPGETASPTQPIPTSLPALSRNSVTADELKGLTEADGASCRAALRGRERSDVFTPPSLEGGIEVPGLIGGMNWSGYAFDPQRQLLVVNVTNMVYETGLIPRDGHPPAGHYEIGTQLGTPYEMYRRVLKPAGSRTLCTPGPWGELVGVDLAHGTIRWRVPLGSLQALAHGGQNLPAGTPSLGGPIVTAGGLAFIAGTVLDPYLRAFDLDTGKELWKARLPAPGHATPMTYQWQGRQYVVIAAGGGANIDEETQSDAIVAYALPQP